MFRDTMLQKNIIVLAFVNIVLIISIGQRLNAQGPIEISDNLQHATDSRHITSGNNNISEGNENIIDFDTLAVCQNLAKSFTKKNTSDAAYTLDTAIITGLDKDEFSIVIYPNYPITINPGGVFSFAIAYGYGPTSIGNKSARLEIITSRPDNPLIIVNLQCYVDSFEYRILPELVDFGAVPIFSSHTKTINLENRSIFEIAYRIEYINNPDIQLSAVSGTIAAFATDNIDVAVRTERPVYIYEQLMFIIESPCTDTALIDISAELQNNEPIVTRNLDFGEIVLCDSSRRTIKYENTLDVPVYLDSIRVSGPDNNLFTVQNFIGPTAIEPDGTYEHEIVFLSKSSIAGAKNATAESFLTFGSIGKIYSTELAGSFLPSLSFSEQEIDFGDIEVGEFAERSIVITNNNNRPITINEIKPFIHSQIFLLSPAIIDTVLDFGNRIELKIQFLPDINMTYFDTLWLSNTDGNCSADIPVSIIGTGLQNLNIWIPSLFTAIGSKDFFIPIKSKINISKSSLINVSFEIQINLNSNIFKPFEPYYLTNGFAMLSEEVVGNERILTIRGEGLTLDGEPKTLTAIHGQVLLSDFTYTPIEIKSFWWSEDISSTIKNGELTVSTTCNPQLGLIRSFSLSEMNVYKEYGSNDVRIEVVSGETGRFELFYIDLLGRANRVASWQQSNPTGAVLNEFIINAANLYGNVYNVWLRTPMASISRLITIVK